jgi:hypothetical protein
LKQSIAWHLAYREASMLAFADAFRAIMLAFLVATLLVPLIRKVMPPKPAARRRRANVHVWERLKAVAAPRLRISCGYSGVADCAKLVAAILFENTGQPSITRASSLASVQKTKFWRGDAIIEGGAA